MSEKGKSSRVAMPTVELSELEHTLLLEKERGSSRLEALGKDFYTGIRNSITMLDNQIETIENEEGRSHRYYDLLDKRDKYIEDTRELIIIRSRKIVNLAYMQSLPEESNDEDIRARLTIEEQNLYDTLRSYLKEFSDTMVEYIEPTTPIDFLLTRFPFTVRGAVPQQGIVQGRESHEEGEAGNEGVDDGLDDFDIGDTGAEDVESFIAESSPAEGEVSSGTPPVQETHGGEGTEEAPVVDGGIAEVVGHAEAAVSAEPKAAYESHAHADAGQNRPEARKDARKKAEGSAGKKEDMPSSPIEPEKKKEGLYVLLFNEDLEVSTYDDKELNIKKQGMAVLEEKLALPFLRSGYARSLLD